MIPEYSPDGDYLKSHDIVPIVIPGYTQETVNKQIEELRTQKVADPNTFAKHQLDYFFNTIPYFLDDLKAMHFDMLIVDRFNDMQLIANYLDIPILVKNIERIVDPAIMTELGSAPSHSS